ncbi:hypothetical protein JXL21_08720, partial [Candidatus Bathyarchaeota archaeon]|nr:hypothetical protein [Candidatus Bathyarchaeota archaeon]
INIDIDKFENTFIEIKKKVKNQINELYKTRCPNCGELGILSHVVWAKEDGDIKNETPIEEWYFCECMKEIQKKDFDIEDRAFLNKVNNTPIPYWIPDTELIWNTRINVHKNTKVTDLFTHRNLIALSILLHNINEITDENIKELMRFVFTGFVFNSSRMNFVNVGGYRSLGRGWAIRGYWVPGEHLEQNVWNDFERQYNRVKKGKIESNSEVNFNDASSFDEIKDDQKNILILNGSALNIPLPKNSVDYVFTDPPYGDSIPYVELHYMWSSWLDFKVNFDDEIIISNSSIRKDKNFEFYHKMLSKAFREIYRVLKPDKWLTVTFHNTDIKIYNSIIKVVILAGFDLEKIVFQPPAKTSAKGLLAPYGSAVGDYYIRFRKTEKETQDVSIYGEIDKERYERIIIDTVKHLIAERGEPSTYSNIVNSYPLIYDQLKKSGYLFSAPESIEDILKRNLNKEFVLIDVYNDDDEVIGQKWWVKGVKFLDRVPLTERVEAITVNILNKEITVSFDDVLRQVYLIFTNSLTPDTQSVKEVLEEYAEKTKDGKWRLKPIIQKRESEHDLMVELLALIGEKAGYTIYADIAKRRTDLTFDLAPDVLSRIKEIDVIWYNDDEIEYEFEVENTTGITEAIVRGSNITNPKTKRFIVIPEEREAFFKRKTSEPMLKEMVENYNWDVIYYDAIKTFYEEIKSKTSIDVKEFEALSGKPAPPLEQKELDFFKT